MDNARHSKYWQCCYNWPRQFELLALAEALVKALGRNGHLRLVWHGMQLRMFSETCPLEGGAGVTILTFMQQYALRVLKFDVALNVPLPRSADETPYVASWEPRRDAHGQIAGLLRTDFGIRYR